MKSPFIKVITVVFFLSCIGVVVYFKSNNASDLIQLTQNSIVPTDSTTQKADTNATKKLNRKMIWSSKSAYIVDDELQQYLDSIKIKLSKNDSIVE